MFCQVLTDVNGFIIMFVKYGEKRGYGCVSPSKTYSTKSGKQLQMFINESG